MPLASAVTSRDPFVLERDKGASLDRLCVLTICVAWLVGLLAIIWAVSGFGVNDVAIDVAWFGAAFGVGAVLITSHVADRCSWRLRLVSLVLAVLALTGVVWATQTNLIAKTKLQLDVSSWQATMVAAHLDTVGDRCERVPPVTFKDFGAVSRACGTNSTSEFAPSTEFLSSAAPGSSLIYYPHPGIVPGGDVCVAHVSGPWWQNVAIGLSADCSAGFQFVGGG